MRKFDFLKNKIEATSDDFTSPRHYIPGGRPTFADGLASLSNHLYNPPLKRRRHGFPVNVQKRRTKFQSNAMKSDFKLVGSDITKGMKDFHSHNF